MSILDWIDNQAMGDAQGAGSMVAYASGLPGQKDGPQDALRHVTRAALLAYEDPEYARWILEWREWAGSVRNNSRPGMDNWNNEIGIRIGSCAESADQAVALTVELFEQNLTGQSPGTIQNWIMPEGSDGYMVTPSGGITLSNGMVVQPIALYPPSDWRTSSGEVEDLSRPFGWPDGDPAWREQLVRAAAPYLSEFEKENEKSEEVEVPNVPHCGNRDTRQR